MHRLRPIDTHLALYTMLYNISAKNRYAKPVHNETKQISKIRDDNDNVSKRTLHTCVTASN